MQIIYVHTVTGDLYLNEADGSLSGYTSFEDGLYSSGLQFINGEDNQEIDNIINASIAITLPDNIFKANPTLNT